MTEREQEALNQLDKALQDLGKALDRTPPWPTKQLEVYQTTNTVNEYFREALVYPYHRLVELIHKRDAAVIRAKATEKQK